MYTRHWREGIKAPARRPVPAMRLRSIQAEEQVHGAPQALLSCCVLGMGVSSVHVDIDAHLAVLSSVFYYIVLCTRRCTYGMALCSTMHVLCHASAQLQGLVSCAGEHVVTPHGASTDTLNNRMMAVARTRFALFHSHRSSCA